MNKLSLKEIIEMSKQPRFKKEYVIACTDSVMDNKYNWIIAPTLELVERWYNTFANHYTSVAIYHNGKYLQQIDKMH